MSRTTVFAFVLLLVVGCSEQSAKLSGDVSSSTTPVAFNVAGAPTVEFSVPDMMCPEGCGAKVKEILSEQAGAKDVLIDFPNKTATVAIDKDTFDPKQAVAALVDHQFNHSVLKEADAGENVVRPATPDTTSVQ